MEGAGEPAAQVAAEGERVQLGERPPGGARGSCSGCRISPMIVALRFLSLLCQ